VPPLAHQLVRLKAAQPLVLLLARSEAAQKQPLARSEAAQ
jgi:hypothetical protein